MSWWWSLSQLSLGKRWDNTKRHNNSYSGDFKHLFKKKVITVFLNKLKRLYFQVQQHVTGAVRFRVVICTSWCAPYMISNQITADSGEYTVLLVLDLTSALIPILWSIISTCMNRVMSERTVLPRGVPQRSILGPLLFWLLPIGHIFRCNCVMLAISYYLYANDVQLHGCFSFWVF